MSPNVKKKSASHIYYGVQKDTGEILHISQVQRGKACGCVCAKCNEVLEARKGEERRHHFAHVSNYECVFGNEVAMYRFFAEELEKNKQLVLPEIRIGFPTRKYGEVIRQRQTIEIDTVEYQCALKDYPPKLFVTLNGHRLRILLDFGKYFDENDKRMFYNEAAAEGYSLLMYSLPKMGDDDSDDAMRKLVANLRQKTVNAEWLFSEFAERSKKRYEGATLSQKTNEKGYLRPISKNYLKNQFDDTKVCQADLDAEAERICSCFDENSKEPTFDKYGRRWLKCEICGCIKESVNMPYYQYNLGICNVCEKERA